MAEMTFINNNTFTSYLHSRSMVQHFYPNLQDNMYLFQLSRWCNMALLSWALTFPILGSLQYPKPFSVLGLQALMALTSHWRRILTWAYVDNTPIELWQFLFVLQLDLNSSLIAYHCPEWKNSFSMLGTQFPKELQFWLYKSLKRGFPLLTYEV